MQTAKAEEKEKMGENAIAMTWTSAVGNDIRTNLLSGIMVVGRYLENSVIIVRGATATSTV